jgi:2-succinyl-5-enolpyruvyl-6-hydroxy-3-cyclohexene-1-carboxylate synthase
MIAVTADRPARLRGTDANQTTDQVGVFGPLVPTLDLADAAMVPDVLALLRLEEGSERHGPPLHLNVQLEEPLVPGERWAQAPGVRAERSRGPFLGGDGEVTTLPGGPAGPRTVVVAGDDAGPPARMLAQDAGWPLLAEPTSGSRTGEHAIRCYRLLLDGALGQEIERVVVYGHPTLSRPVSRLLARDDVEVWAAPTPGRELRRAFPVTATFDRARSSEPDHTDWHDRWRQADVELGRSLDRLLRAEPGLTPYDVAGAVATALPAGGLLTVGASSPIRDLDLMVPRYDVGGRRKVIANRGLSGIDGVVSTAIGAALGRHSTRSLALLGDVTFLHDSNGLVVGPGQPGPDLTIVVVNDDGGSIFAMLEQGAPAYADRYEALFGTPHGVDLAGLCAATGTPHLRVTSRPALEQALASPNGGVEVVEAVCRRDNRRDLDERIRALGRPA